jgi:hypothetical protein
MLADRDLVRLGTALASRLDFQNWLLLAGADIVWAGKQLQPASAMAQVITAKARAMIRIRVWAWIDRWPPIFR